MNASQNYKVIVVGETGAGKTTIIQRLVQGTFREEAQATVGVEFKSFICDVDGKKKKLQIWDTAGQERFRSVAKSYFRNAVGALIVFDVTSISTFEAISGWLNDVQELSHPNSVILLIGNKIDLPEREVSSLEATAFAERHNLYYCETSAKTGDGILDSFVRIAREISNRVESGQLILPLLKTQPMMYTNPNQTSETAKGRQEDADQCSC